MPGMPFIEAGTSRSAAASKSRLPELSMILGSVKRPSLRTVNSTSAQ
jgi:hypothetical protein